MVCVICGQADNFNTVSFLIHRNYMLHCS
jgi:hypothetical protein